MARTWKIYVWTILAFIITWLASQSMAALATHDNSIPGLKGAKNATNSSAPRARPLVAKLRVSPIARGGVFPVGSAVKSASRATQENEYYSYEYSDEPLANDNNNSGKSEAAIWLQGVVPDPEAVKAAEEIEGQALSDEPEEEVELPENSLADGDLHDHDVMDSVMFIYFGPNEQESGGTTSQVVLAGMVVALLAQGLTAFGALRKVARSRCRSTPSAGIPSGSVHAAIVLLHTELALATASLVFIFAVHATMDGARCEAVSLLLHYLHLSAACWLTANSVRVYIWLARETSLAHERSSSRPPGLQGLAVIAWALPLLLVLLSYMIHPRGYEYRRYCWLSIQKGMLVSYLVPVAFLITATTALAVMGVRKAPHKLHCTAAEDAARLSLRLSAWTMPLFAVSWFFSVLALEQSQSLAASLLFAITVAIFNWFVFACSSTLFPDCPSTLVRNFHPLAMPAGPHGPGNLLTAPPSPLQNDAQPLLPAATAGMSGRDWNHGWTPRTHPELPSPAERSVWAEDDDAGGSAGAAASSALACHPEDDLIEPEETSELLELRLENISTISA